jgi:glycerol-3-phosphate dehydrogenase
MRRDAASLESRAYDVIVVGGGFFGAFAAWEAASRGLSVCLLERGDFCAETSANSYKIVHGGVRYLQHGDVTRVVRSSAERSAFLRIAPHLVEPLPILMPTHGRGMKGKGVLSAGFAVYDALTWRRNRGIRDSARHIPRARTVSRATALQAFPGLETDGLTGGLVFHDAQMYNPPRLVLSVLRAAEQLGAALGNRMDVTGFLTRGRRVHGVRAWDRVEGRALEIQGSTVLNAAGPWASRLLGDLDVELADRAPAFSRDVGLVVERRFPSTLGLACTTSSRDADALLDRGGRHLFLLPWKEHTLVGVWHGRYEGSPDEVDITRAEIEEFLADANHAYPPLELGLDDVVTVHTGLILYNDDDEAGTGHHFGHRSMIVDHGAEDGVEGLVTILGERATMARSAAERSVDIVFRRLGRASARSVTAHTPVFGGDVADFEALVAGVPAVGRKVLPEGVRRALAHNYGTRHGDVLTIAREATSLAETVGASSVLAAEVIHAVRHEMALALDDVVFRRTDLGVGRRPTRDDLELCARLMAAELGWDAERERSEVDRVAEIAASGGPFEGLRRSEVPTGPIS